MREVDSSKLFLSAGWFFLGVSVSLFFGIQNNWLSVACAIVAILLFDLYRRRRGAQ